MAEQGSQKHRIFIKGASIDESNKRYEDVEGYDRQHNERSETGLWHSTGSFYYLDL